MYTEIPVGDIVHLYVRSHCNIPFPLVILPEQRHRVWIQRQIRLEQGERYIYDQRCQRILPKWVLHNVGKSLVRNRI